MANCTRCGAEDYDKEMKDDDLVGGKLCEECVEDLYN